DALVEAGEVAHPEAVGEHRLSDQEQGEVAARVELGASEDAEDVELCGAQRMGLVDDKEDLAVALQGLGGEQCLCLADELGDVEAEADAGDRLLETRADEELVGGDGLRERHARKVEVAEPGRGAHHTSSSWMSGR